MWRNGSCEQCRLHDRKLQTARYTRTNAISSTRMTTMEWSGKGNQGSSTEDTRYILRYPATSARLRAQIQPANAKKACQYQSIEDSINQSINHSSLLKLLGFVEPSEGSSLLCLFGSDDIIVLSHLTRLLPQPIKLLIIRRSDSPNILP